MTTLPERVQSEQDLRDRERGHDRDDHPEPERHHPVNRTDSRQRVSTAMSSITSTTPSPSMGVRRWEGSSIDNDATTTRLVRATLCLALLLFAAPLWAQQDASSLTPEQRRIAALEATNKQLVQQLVDAQKARPLTDDELKRKQEGYVTLFAQLKYTAGFGCKAAGGQLSIALTATGSVASLTCVLK